MSASYIPKKTYAVCTYQLGSEPMQFIDTRSKVTIRHKSELLLTKEDRNINAQFTCKSPVNAMSSFLAFGAGILIAAVALSNPIGWIVLGCAALAIGAAYAVVVITHKCSGPLKGGQWISYHPKVFLDGHNAITEISMLKCGSGGVLKAFFSSSDAHEAAQHIQNNNLKEFAVNTAASFFGGLLLPEAFAATTISKFTIGTIAGIGSIYALTYGERAVIRNEGSMENNKVYQDLNEKVDDNSLLPDYTDKTYYNPGSLSNTQDLKNFADAYKSGHATVNDLQIQSQLDAIANMSRQQLYRDATARGLLARLNAGELPHLREAMNRFNPNRINPTMVGEATVANSVSMKKNLGAMAQKGGEGILFFMPLVATYFSENARKDFADAAVKDMGNGINIVAQTQ